MSLNVEVPIGGGGSVTAAAIEATFTAANQIYKGTGSGTGALQDFGTVLNFQFAAAGQLFVGTGAGTGEKLAIGSAGQVLTVGGADPSGLEWAAAPPGAALATAREVAVGTGTTIVTYTPAASGNFLVAIYFRVITATTNVTVTVTWTDATGAQTLTLLNVVAETTGSYTFTSFMVDDLATDAITVTMTAGTASQVYASASIMQG